MTQADHNLIKEMNSEMIKHISEILDLKLTIINNKLDATVIQTTKTNGSVLNHSERILTLEQNKTHTVTNCPQQPIIQEMRDEMITRKSIKKMLLTTVTAIGLIVGAIATIIALLQQASIQ